MADNHPSSAIVAQRARDADGSRFTGQLVCPLTDCDLDTAPYVGFGDHHAPDTSDRTRSEASPPQDYLPGLPPAVVLTAEHDPSRDEGSPVDHVVDAVGEPSRRPAGVTGEAPAHEVSRVKTRPTGLRRTPL